MEFFTFAWITDPQIWLSLVTLCALEIVLGIDNLVFIAILTGRLPEHQRSLGRKVGLALALVTRLMLLATLAWIVGLTQPVFTIAGKDFSWRDIILIAGGLFLLYKATVEIHEMIEKEEGDPDKAEGAAGVTFKGVVIQIAIIDIIFSLDSVITAVGMADHLWVMVVAVVMAMLIMIAASDPLANFVSAHPTVKMLALSFLLLIGVVLIADGLGVHVPKGYIYFALAFSVAVETLNQWARRRRKRLKGA
ncbi:MAG TPA: TerC family protein [Usitatibacteraceae bacterium]|nr:TerC family protein [Usitatibacteraceae bacterium]